MGKTDKEKTPETTQAAASAPDSSSQPSLDEAAANAAREEECQRALAEADRQRAADEQRRIEAETERRRVEEEESRLLAQREQEQPEQTPTSVEVTVNNLGTKLYQMGDITSDPEIVALLGDGSGRVRRAR